MDVTAISAVCHEDTIPPFIEGKLEQLYGSVYASFAQFSVYGGLEGASTYVARSGEDIRDIFLFRRDGQNVCVINEQIHASAAAINLFAQTIYSRYPAVDVITFHAIETDGAKLAFPAQRFICTNDISMALPGTVQEYYGRLGKSTRKTLNQNSNRIQRRYPSFRFQAFEGNETSEQQIRQIIDFNRMRMAGKSRMSAIDDQETKRIIEFTRRCGLVGIVTIDDKPCAGSICYRIGDSYFLRVIAHDPQYNAYGLGMLCCYRTICECIERGGRKYHFMWGQEEYKYRLLGTERQLQQLTIYRSRSRMLANAGIMARTAIDGRFTQCHLWALERMRHKESLSGRALAKCVSFMRAGKRLLPGSRISAKPAELQLSQRK